MSKKHELVAEHWEYQALRKHLFNHIFQFAFDLTVFKQSKGLKESYFSYIIYGIDVRGVKNIAKEEKTKD